MLNELFVDLTEAFTTMNCEDVDQLLRGIEGGSLSLEARRKLRAAPALRPDHEIREHLAKKYLPESLFTCLKPAIKNRCEEQGTSEQWWRKGFGYSLLLGTLPRKDDSESSACSELRILPGVYCGPGGVVEAQGVFLQRPEDRQVPFSVVQEKSKVLHELAALLRAEGHSE